MKKAPLLHFTSVRMRPYEYAAVEAARAASGESQSGFLRRSAVLLARATLADADVWDTPQQRRDNAVTDRLQAESSGDDA